MKKLLIILCVISNSILFLSVISIFEEKDEADIYNLDWYSNDVVDMTIEFNDKINTYNHKEVLIDLKNISNTYNVLLHINDADYVNKTFNIYSFSNKNIDTIFNLVTTTSLNFNESNTSYYHNYNKDAVTFYLLNKRLDVSIRSLLDIGEREAGLAGHLNVVAENEQNLQRAIADIETKYGDAINKTIDFERGELDVDTMLSSTLSTIMFFSFTTLFLVIIMYVYQSSKKIAIMKLQGLSYIMINKELYANIFLVLVLTVYATLGILFYSYIGVINERTVPIIRILITFSFIEIIGLIISIAVSNLLLLFIPKSQLIKNSSFNKYLMIINYCIKGISLFVIILLIVPHFSIISDNIESIRYLKKYEKDILNYQYVDNITMEYRFDDYANNIIEYTGLFYNSQDQTIINNSEILLKYQEGYDILNKQGAIYCNNIPIMFNDAESTDGLAVNTNYISKYPIYDVNGDLITDELINNKEVTYLVPIHYLEIYGNQQIQGDYFGNDYQIIPISNTQHVFNFNALHTMEPLNKSPILLVYSDNAFRLDKSIIQHMYSDKDINILLEGSYYYNKLVISNVDELIQGRYSFYTQTILSHLYVVIPSLLLLGGIIYQYCYLYIKVHTKRLYVKYLMGISNFKIFSDLYIESILIFLLPVVSIYYIGNVIPIVIFLIIYDIIICSIKTVIFRRRNITNYLKGEGV